MKTRTLLPLCAAFALSACLDEGATARPIYDARAAAQFSARQMADYAFSHASPVAPQGIVTRRPDMGSASMLCPLYDGTGAAVFLVWPDGMTRANHPAARSYLASIVGADLTTAAKAGAVPYRGVDLAKLPGCALPPLADGTPVLALPLKMQAAAFAEFAKEETRTEACPPGYAGSVMQKRVVVYATDGEATAGEWVAAGVGGCAVQTHVTHERETRELQPWTTGGAGTIARLLEENSPTSCVTGTTTRDQDAETDGDTWRMTTCAQATVEARAVPVPEPAPAPEPVYCHIQGLAGNMTDAQRYIPELRRKGFDAIATVGTLTVIYGVAGLFSSAALTAPQPCPYGLPSKSAACMWTASNAYLCGVK